MPPSGRVTLSERQVVTDADCMTARSCGMDEWMGGDVYVSYLVFLALETDHFKAL